MNDLERRYRLMVVVACSTLRSDPDLKLCEGLRLIEATRTAVARLAPGSIARFDGEILPRMREILMDRYGIVDLERGPLH